MVRDIEADTDKHEEHNKMLKKEKNYLEDELSSLELRLTSIRKEKELLFSRMMTVERDIEKLAQWDFNNPNTFFESLTWENMNQTFDK